MQISNYCINRKEILKKNSLCENWTLYSAGWSDLPLIAIFEIGHIDGNQEYFYEFSSEKSVSLTALAEKVLFSTNHRDLKQEAEKKSKMY